MSNVLKRTLSSFCFDCCLVDCNLFQRSQTDTLVFLFFFFMELFSDFRFCFLFVGFWAFDFFWRRTKHRNQRPNKQKPNSKARKPTTKHQSSTMQNQNSKSKHPRTTIGNQNTRGRVQEQQLKTHKPKKQIQTPNIKQQRQHPTNRNQQSTVATQKPQTSKARNPNFKTP